MNGKPAILTNMAFWQSGAWTAATTSIYPMEGRASDPEVLSPWREAWLLFRQRARFDAVVTMGTRATLAYGLLCAVAGADSKQIFTEVFIDDAKPGSFFWRMKAAAFRLVARRAIGVLTNSSMEVETNAARFRLPLERVRFVPMHSNIPFAEPSAADGGYVLSAGRTLRDYATLLAAASRIESRIAIVCGRDDLAGVKMPANVEILREIPRDVYLEKLRRCSLVALPLLPTERSTGQVVVLEAMALGKPVVATRSPGTIDLIRDRENGRLVPPLNAEALAAAVNDLLARKSFAAELAARARADVTQSRTFDLHAEEKLRAIADLLDLRRSESQR